MSPQYNGVCPGSSANFILTNFFITGLNTHFWFQLSLVSSYSMWQLLGLLDGNPSQFSLWSGTVVLGLYWLKSSDNNSHENTYIIGISLKVKFILILYSTADTFKVHSSKLLQGIELGDKKSYVHVQYKRIPNKQLRKKNLTLWKLHSNIPNIH